MSKYVRKSHSVSVLLYHLVGPTKYRRIVFNQKVDETLKRVCLDISARYEIAFIEIGVDKDHAHFLIQSVPSNSPGEIAQLVKSITGREIFKRVPEIKKQLLGGAFWTSDYFINTVGQYGNENTNREYVQFSRLRAKIPLDFVFLILRMRATLPSILNHVEMPIGIRSSN